MAVRRKQNGPAGRDVEITEADIRQAELELAAKHPERWAGQSGPKVADESPVLRSPCPLCGHVWACPFARNPRDECLDLWPLGRPTHRQLSAETPTDEARRACALRDPFLREVIHAWETGGQVSDEQYLRLRSRWLVRGADTDKVCEYILRELLGARMLRHVGDALEYYEITLDRKSWQSAAFTAFHGAAVLARDDMVKADAESPVQSHFERLFYSTFTMLFYAFLEVESLQMPLEASAFNDAFEAEWRRVLRYGNGYHGLTVFPRLSILDMVRYQELGGRDQLVSWSVCEYVTLLMDAFPYLVQRVAPKFREVALQRRLVSMFAPLVGRCASEAVRRQLIPTKHERALKRERIIEEFNAVLKDALDSYDFMYGKTGLPEEAVGMLGLSASPTLRSRVGAALEALETGLDTYDLAHVGPARHVEARLMGHLRKHYPPTARDSAERLSLDESRYDDDTESYADGLQGDNDVDLDAVQRRMGAGAAETAGDDGLSDDGGDPKSSNDTAWASGRGLPSREVVACEVDDVKYLYVDEMARRCGVTAHQLRHWDESGDVRALRFGAVNPKSNRKESLDWRVYPDTPEMIHKIMRVRMQMRAAQRGRLGEDEFTRTAAANALGRNPETLKRWEKAEIAKPIWRDRRPVYTVGELRRLVAVKGIKIPEQSGAD